MQHPLHPTGRSVAEFFGLRYLRSRDLIAMGLIPNRVTLNRMLRDGEFPQPLRLTSRILIWDSTEVAALLERLGAERNLDWKWKKKPAAGTAAGAVKSVLNKTSGWQAATTTNRANKKEAHRVEEDV